MPFPSPGHLSNPGIEPQSPTLQADFFYPLSHQGSLDAYKEGLGADVSKTETCSKHSPAPLEGHVGVCSEGGQGKQVRVWEGQSMDSDSLAIRQPRLTWLAITGSLFPQQVLPDWGLSLAPQAPDDCLSFRKSRGRACTWPLCALRNRSISAVLTFLPDSVLPGNFQTPLVPSAWSSSSEIRGLGPSPSSLGSSFTSSPLRATCPDPLLHTPPFTLPH